MRASRQRMLRRRRRTFLLASILTVTGLYVAQTVDGNASTRPTVSAASVAPVSSASGSKPDVVGSTLSGRDAPRSAVGAPVGYRCPERAAACVNLTEGSAWLQRDGQTSAGPFPATGGRPGHPTPIGTFTVTAKVADYRSRKYDLPMPFSVFFAGDGIAFHQGPLRVRSHGCVHLEPIAAQTFFEQLRNGDVVYVA